MEDTYVLVIQKVWERVLSLINVKNSVLTVAVYKKQKYVEVIYEDLINLCACEKQVSNRIWCDGVDVDDIIKFHKNIFQKYL